MRIIYLTRGYGAHDHRFLSALAETEHQVFLLRLEGGIHPPWIPPVPAVIQQPKWIGDHWQFRWRDIRSPARDLRRVAQSVRADLIHAGPVNTCGFVAVLSGFRPILAMSWGFDLQEDARRNIWWQGITRYTLRRSTFFTCDARVTGDLAEGYGMPRNRMSYFPWGVDLRHFSPPGTSVKARHLGRRFVLLCNRSWEPRYGVLCVARAFAQVARENPEMALILLGDGSEESAIKSTLDEAGVIDRVEFGGRVSRQELPQWYRKADLYVSASHIDGSSVSLMEALACGLPALVSDIPANREWVEQEVNGWRFPDGDVRVLARRMAEISSRRRELPGFGARARQTAEKKADWRTNFQVLLRTYEETVRVHAESEA